MNWTELKEEEEEEKKQEEEIKIRYDGEQMERRSVKKLGTMGLMLMVIGA